MSRTRRVYNSPNSPISIWNHDRGWKPTGIHIKDYGIISLLSGSIMSFCPNADEKTINTKLKEKSIIFVRLIAFLEKMNVFHA